MMHENSNKCAVIAMALRFPGADNLEQFWDILRLGKESIQTFSKKQSLAAGIAEAVIESESYRPYRGIVNLEELYKPKLSNTLFNGLSIQGKMMSHLTHQALMSMGDITNQLIKKTSVFMGTHNLLLTHSKQAEFQPLNTKKIIENYYLKTIAPYIAYEHGFQGAAIDLYTACSSSSVAVIQACKELNTNQCDMAIAGGVSINLPQEIGYLYEKGGILSKDGHCRPFDRDASGTVFSNGAGVLVLKRYDDAIKDNDHIHAIITGYGINNDGKLKNEFTDPGISGQYSCLRAAWSNANISPEGFDYIEAHGAATQLGDAIELYALQKALCSFNITNPCPLGSIKSNIGHTIMASGMASLIKAILILKHKIIPPSIHFQRLNSTISLENSPLYIATQQEYLSKTKAKHTVAVSNFGFGGTNAHIILQNENH